MTRAAVSGLVAAADAMVLKEAVVYTSLADAACKRIVDSWCAALGAYKTAFLAPKLF